MKNAQEPEAPLKIFTKAFWIGVWAGYKKAAEFNRTH
jgi:hypothetical protein